MSEASVPERVESAAGFTRNLAEFRDDVQSWASDLPFTNEMIKQAIITFQTMLATLSKVTGRTIDVSPPMVVWEQDDLPDQFNEVLDADGKENFEGPEPEWKWNHDEEGYGDITVMNFADPNTAEIPYAPEDKGLVITLGGSDLSSAQTIYLIPAHLAKDLE